MSEPTGEQIVQAVKAHLGQPYVYGAEGPSAFDCSGLVQYALEHLGVKSVPRTSEDQWGWSKLSSVKYANLQPGDLIFSNWPGDGAPPGHVAVYAGNGKLIEAPRPGVPIHQIPLDADYRSHVMGYKRLTGAKAGAAPAGDDSSGVAAGIASVGAELANASTFVQRLLMPETWLRLVAFVLGAGALGAGAWLMISEAGARDA